MVGSRRNLPAEPSPASSRSVMDESLSMVFCSLAANCSTLASLPSAPFPAFHERHDAVEALQQRVHVLQCALTGANHILKLRMLASGQSISIRSFRTLGG